jgi:hypothetical protein
VRHMLLCLFEERHGGRRSDGYVGAWVRGCVGAWVRGWMLEEGGIWDPCSSCGVVDGDGGGWIGSGESRLGMAWHGITAGWPVEAVRNESIFTRRQSKVERFRADFVLQSSRFRLFRAVPSLDDAKVRRWVFGHLPM